MSPYTAHAQLVSLSVENLMTCRAARRQEREQNTPTRLGLTALHCTEGENVRGEQRAERESESRERVLSNVIRTTRCDVRPWYMLYSYLWKSKRVRVRARDRVLGGGSRSSRKLNSGNFPGRRAQSARHATPKLARQKVS